MNFIYIDKGMTISSGLSISEGTLVSSFEGIYCTNPLALNAFCINYLLIILINVLLLVSVLFLSN